MEHAVSHSSPVLEKYTPVLTSYCFSEPINYYYTQSYHYSIHAFMVS
jgi:hypothetical protein